MIYQYFARLQPKYRFHRRYKQSIPDKELRTKVLTTPCELRATSLPGSPCHSTASFRFSKTLAADLAAPESGSGLLSLFRRREPGEEQNAVSKTKVITIPDWHTGPFGPVFEMVSEASKGGGAAL